jgi:hypothetical protein
MATYNQMKLADMIVPEVFHRYTQQYSTVNTAFWQSGIVTDMSDIIDSLGGTTVHMPFFNDLDGEDDILDDTQDISVGKTSTSMDVATRLFRVRAYGGTDLSGDLAGADPMASILNNFGAWWGRQLQKTLLSVVAGAMGSLNAETATNGTSTVPTNHNTNSPNNLDITGLTGAAAVFDAESFIDAAQRLGDASDGMGAIAIHSMTYALMRKQDLIDFIRASDAEPAIPYYMGKRVIVSDVMPVDANGNYTSYIFGQGAIGYVEKAPKTPVELYREPLKNGGQDNIIHRRQFVLHPRGVKWIGVPASNGKTPSNVELATAANWTRVYDNKLIRIVAFKHKVA